MQDSDARIEGVEDERDKYKKALEEIIEDGEQTGEGAKVMFLIAKEALKDG
jgi:hypothetical protein